MTARRTRATAYCTTTPGCVMEVTHKGECYVPEHREVCPAKETL